MIDTEVLSMDNIILVLSPLFLGLLSIFIRSGKGSILIAGFNTASKEEKNKYDVKGLCEFVSNLLFLIAGMLIFRACTILFKIGNFDNIIGIGIVVIVL